MTFTAIPIDPERLLRFPIPEIHHTYDDRETILYALSVGYGTDPLDEHELPFVYEEGLVAAPTMAGVLGYPGFWMQHPDSGIPWVNVVHAQQSLTWHRPIPPTGT